MYHLKKKRSNKLSPPIRGECMSVDVSPVNYSDPSRARGYKTFFMLNLTENEIYSAFKEINTSILTFSCKTEQSMKCILLINIKMPTFLGLLLIISRKISCSGELSMRESFKTSKLVMANIKNIYR